MTPHPKDRQFVRAPLYPYGGNYKALFSYAVDAFRHVWSSRNASENEEYEVIKWQKALFLPFFLLAGLGLTGIFGHLFLLASVFLWLLTQFFFYKLDSSVKTPLRRHIVEAASESRDHIKMMYVFARRFGHEQFLGFCMETIFYDGIDSVYERTTLLGRVFNYARNMEYEDYLVFCRTILLQPQGKPINDSQKSPWFNDTRKLEIISDIHNKIQ